MKKFVLLAGLALCCSAVQAGNYDDIKEKLEANEISEESFFKHFNPLINSKDCTEQRRAFFLLSHAAYLGIDMAQKLNQEIMAAEGVTIFSDYAEFMLEIMPRWILDQLVKHCRSVLKQDKEGSDSN